jgi:reactive intermediate/imine deaminase
MKAFLPAAAGVAAMSLAALFCSTAGAADFLNSSPPTEKSYPTSEAVKVGNLVYLSGKLGTLPGTPTLAAGGIKPEAHQAMENIKALLEKHGWSFKNVVKCTVFLADSSELPQFNEVYKTYFPDFNYPARSAVGVSGLALNARVEVECIAAVEK